MRPAVLRFAATAFLLLTAPLAAVAEPPGKVWRIGHLSGNPPSDTQDALSAFRKRLSDLGYVEGQNLTLEYRYADGQHDRLPSLAADLVRREVDLIFTYGTAASLAAKRATGTIPIVFAGVANPLIGGLVASFPHPGGNVTGTATNNPELAAKRLSLLHEALPMASRIAVLSNPRFPPTADMVAETRAAAQSLGVQLQLLEVREPQELQAAFGTMIRRRADALYVLPDVMFLSQRDRIVELAAANRIPTMYHLRQFVEAGGLMAYGASYIDAFRESAAMVAKVLRGAKPADLPVQQPWRYEMLVNLRTAKALGLTIPRSVLLRADQVIE